jgi:hypothetical protein
MKSDFNKVVDAEVVMDERHRVRIIIGERGGKFDIAFRYINGYFGSSFSICPNIEGSFPYSTLKKAMEVAKENLLSTTSEANDPITARNNSCKHTKQMFNSIMDQLEPRQLELF